MKARINAAVPKVAVGINVSEEKETVLKSIADSLGFVYKTADADCGNDTAGCLCGIGGQCRSEERCTVQDEILLFSGLNGNEMSKFLDLMRKNNIKIPLKAMLTPNNKSWTISALAEELAREHELMNNRKQGDSNGQKEI